MPKHLGFIYLDLTLYFTDSTSFRVLLTEAINLNTQIFCLFILVVTMSEPVLNVFSHPAILSIFFLNTRLSTSSL